MNVWFTSGRARLAALLLACAFGSAIAQGFPSRVVRIVVPFPPGGSAEAQARLIGQRLSETWNQPVIVESKPGAGSTIGAAFAAAAAPDGYTLYLASTSHTISASLYKNLPYDAVRSFAPVALVAASPFILAVHPAVAATTVREFIDLAKAKPNTLSWASSGNGAGPHLSGEIFRNMTGIEVTHIPFKGTSPAMVALIGGQVEFTMADVAIVPHFQTGKARGLAVTTAKRSALVPGLPTLAESGLAGYETTNWSALLAPAGTPREIVSQVNAAVVNAIRTPEMRSRFNAQGFEPVGGTPEETAAHLAVEVTKYAKAIRDSGTRID